MRFKQPLYLSHISVKQTIGQANALAPMLESPVCLYPGCLLGVGHSPGPLQSQNSLGATGPFLEKLSPQHASTGGAAWGGRPRR